MSAETNWASLKDFATLFQYFWHRDVPIGQKALGAKRSDWTIHIGIVVRNIADLMGLYARFEAGRKDAVLRNRQQDLIALEWEWEALKANDLKKLKKKPNELQKLKEHKVFASDPSKKEPLRYCVSIAYTPHIEGGAKTYDEVYKDVYGFVHKEWENAPCPLLLVLIDFVKSKKYWSGREFQNIQMTAFDKEGRTPLRQAPALPWKVPAPRWPGESG